MNHLKDRFQETNENNNLIKIHYACNQFFCMVKEYYLKSYTLDAEDYLFIFKPRLSGLSHLLKVLEHIEKKDNSFKVVVFEHKHQYQNNYCLTYNDIENNKNIIHLLFGLYSCIVFPVFNNELILNVYEPPYKKGIRLKEIKISSLDEYINYFDIDDFLKVKIEEVNSTSVAEFNNNDNYEDESHYDNRVSNKSKGSVESSGVLWGDKD